MDEKERALAYAEYEDGVKWVREHVAKDDIYDFAHQLILAAEELAFHLNEETDLENLMKENYFLFQSINNILSIGRMKKAGYTGIIDTSWRFLE